MANKRKCVIFWYLEDAVESAASVALSLRRLRGGLAIFPLNKISDEQRPTDTHPPDAGCIPRWPPQFGLPPIASLVVTALSTCQLAHYRRTCSRVLCKQNVQSRSGSYPSLQHTPQRLSTAVAGVPPVTRYLLPELAY